MTTAAKAELAVDVRTWMRGIKNGSTTIVKALLELGADVDTRFDDGRTALMYAASVGNTSLMQTLLRAGADINAQRENGFTPLLDAIFNGHIDAVQNLVKAGADLQVKTSRGSTAEHWANARGFHEISQLLKDAERARKNALVPIAEAASSEAAIEQPEPLSSATETNAGKSAAGVRPIFDAYLSALAVEPLATIVAPLSARSNAERTAADEDVTVVPIPKVQSPDAHVTSIEDSEEKSVERNIVVPNELSATTTHAQPPHHARRATRSLVLPLWRTALIALAACVVSGIGAYKFSTVSRAPFAENQAQPVAEIPLAAPESSSSPASAQQAAVISQPEGSESRAVPGTTPLKQTEQDALANPATVNATEKTAEATTIMNPVYVDSNSTESKTANIATRRSHAPKTPATFVGSSSGKNQLEGKITPVPQTKTVPGTDKSISLKSPERDIPPHVILYPQPRSSRSKATEEKPSAAIEPVALPKKKVIQWP